MSENVYEQCVRYARTDKLHHFNMFPNEEARVTFICMFADNYADFVYCWHTLHHLFINNLYIRIYKSLPMFYRGFGTDKKLHSHKHTHIYDIDYQNQTEE